MSANERAKDAIDLRASGTLGADFSVTPSLRLGPAPYLFFFGGRFPRARRVPMRYWVEAELDSFVFTIRGSMTTIGITPHNMRPPAPVPRSHTSMS